MNEREKKKFTKKEKVYNTHTKKISIFFAACVGKK